MSIRDRFFHYCSKVMHGYVRPGQLINFSRERVMPKNETITWQPTQLSVFVTSRCNFHCDMCPTHSTKIPKSYMHRHNNEPDMTLDLLRFVLKRFPNVIRVALIGVGEPLLNPHFFELVKECVRHRKIVNSVSNGLKLDSYMHDILRSGLDRFCISVNGHTSKEFHRMTGNPEAAYSLILKNVEALVRARDKKRTPRIDLSFIIDRYNYRFMKEMIEVAEDLGADFVYLIPFQASPYPGFTPEERCLYIDDQEVREELARLMSKKFRVDVSWPCLLRRSGAEMTVCRWPFSLLQIDGGGNIGGCPMQLANMHENGKVYDEDLWNNQYFRGLRRRHLQGDLLWPCKSCVESAGVAPSRVLKGKLRLRI